MQNNLIVKISPSVRIIVLFILSLILLLAKSVYLILFITTLTFILVLITDKKVNLYVNTLKKVVIFLLIFLFGYIIVFRYYDFASILLLVYKLFIIALLFVVFILNIDFKSMHAGLYGIFKPLQKININSEKFSLDVTISIYIIKFLMTYKSAVKLFQTINGKNTINLRNFILPRFIYSINQLNVLQDSLKIKFYSLDYKKNDLKSNAVLILILMLLVICLFKEVIL